MKRPNQVREKPLTYAQIRQAKAADRVRDWERLARGEVTPAQLQRENSAVGDLREFRILNDAAATRFFYRRQLARARAARSKR